jgi:hypothetical protein
MARATTTQSAMSTALQTGGATIISSTTNEQQRQPSLASNNNNTFALLLLQQCFFIYNFCCASSTTTSAGRFDGKGNKSHHWNSDGMRVLFPPAILSGISSKTTAHGTTGNCALALAQARQKAPTTTKAFDSKAQLLHLLGERFLSS